MKKQSLLLFKNAFKQAFRNKIQLVGLVVLVLLSATIFSLMQTSLARVSDEYQTLIIKSNLHDFVIDLSDTADVSNTKKGNLNNYIKESTNDVINNISNAVNNEFIWDRVEARTMQLNNNNDTRILKIIACNYNKGNGIDTGARIDKLVISQGFNIGENHNDVTPAIKQTVINKEFAQKNNLKIGDVIRDQNDQLGTSLKVNYDINNPIYSNFNWLKIVGFGNSADFTTPIIDQTTPIPNKTREGILYVDPMQFGLKATKYNPNNPNSNYYWEWDNKIENVTVTSNNDREVYYVGKTVLPEKNNLVAISKQLKNHYVNTTDSSANLVYALGDSAYRFNNRTALLTTTISGFTALLIALLLIVLVITGITVILVTYKNIDNSRTQLGILKSLGYSNIKILITSLAYPMVASVIGTILVFLPASGLQLIVIHTFANYFNLDFGRFIFDGLGFLYCLILTFGFLSIIAWIISALTVVQKPIDLIKNDSVSSNSAFARIVKKHSSNRKFLTRFRISLFTSSIGKMAAASLTMFLGTILMTTAIIGPKIMADNKLLSYTGMNYKSLTEYEMPVYNSPFTMYKTYNPNLKPGPYKTITGADGATYERPDRDDNNLDFVKQLINNSINSESYAPMVFGDNPTSIFQIQLGIQLAFLGDKMLTKDFLQHLDASKITDAAFAPTLVSFAWPDAVPINNLAKLKNGLRPIPTPYTAQFFEVTKQFYRIYRSTVGMNINSKVIDASDSNKFNPDALWNLLSPKASMPAATFDPSFQTDLYDFKFDSSDPSFPLHIDNENELLNNTYSDLGTVKGNSWINKILIWLGALFFNRSGQIILQGTYSRSPYFVKENIANAYNNPDSQFNVSFNVVPFDKNTDELGTYFVGRPVTSSQHSKFDSYPMKVYGLQNAQQLGHQSSMQLYDSSGAALNPLLEQKNSNGDISIVINQTVAKQLGFRTNTEFEMATNGDIMKYKNAAGNYENFDNDQIDYTDIDTTTQPSNNATISLMSTKLPQAGLDDPYQNLGFNAPDILKSVAKGDVVTDQDRTAHFYKVVGVYNGYGQPNAYISKSNADQILNYDSTRSALYRIFKQEWENNPPVDNIDFSVLKTLTYEQFISSPNRNVVTLNQIFNNENPIFNFKFSNSDVLTDISNSFSTSQIYGDYSAFGLNGGSEGSTSYQGYGAGTAVNISPLEIHRQLLNQITDLVDAVLAFFIIFSLIISFFIILLTSNLVIYENRKTIATMKTLGYSDSKITNIVIGMYLPLIALMFAFGFPIGWLIVQYVVNYLAFNTTWVLPLFFAWWLPFLVAGVVFGIYITTFIIDWNAMRRINPIRTLSEID